MAIGTVLSQGESQEDAVGSMPTSDRQPRGGEPTRAPCGDHRTVWQPPHTMGTGDTPPPSSDSMPPLKKMVQVDAWLRDAQRKALALRLPGVVLKGERKNGWGGGAL